MASVSEIITDLAFNPVLKSGPQVVRQVEKFTGLMRDRVDEALGKAVKATFNAKQLTKMKGNLEGLSKKVQGAYKDALDATQELQRKGLKVEERDRLAAIHAEAIARAQESETTFKDEKKRLKDMAQRRIEVSKKSKDGELKGWEKVGDATQKVGDEFASSIQTLISGDLGNISQMFRKMGENAKKGGFAAEAKEADGAAGSMMTTLGKALGALGPALITI